MDREKTLKYFKWFIIVWFVIAIGFIIQGINNYMDNKNFANNSKEYSAKVVSIRKREVSDSSSRDGIVTTRVVQDTDIIFKTNIEKEVRATITLRETPYPKEGEYIKVYYDGNTVSVNKDISGFDIFGIICYIVMLGGGIILIKEYKKYKNQGGNYGTI